MNARLKAFYTQFRFSTSVRMLVAACCLLLYVMLFGAFHGASPFSMTVLSVAPVMVLGALFGQRVGIMGAIGAALLNLALLQPLGNSNLQSMLFFNGGWAGLVTLLLAGFLTGQNHDVRHKLRTELLERQRANDSLNAAQASLRKLIASNADGMLVFSADGKILFMNPAAEQLWQPLSNEMPLAWFGAQLKTSEPAELSLVGVDGSQMVVEMRVAPTEWEGQPAWLAALRDITQRKRAEEALRQSEEKFRRVIEHSQDGISLFDEHGLMIEWNPAMETITGLPRPAVLGLPVWRVLTNLIHSDQMSQARAAEIENRYREYLHTGISRTSAVDIKIRRPDGSQRVVQEQPFHIPTANGYQGGAIVRDITLLRSRDRQLRLMQMAIDHASNGIVITDPHQPDNPIIYANPGFERMTGYPAAEVVGRNCRFLQRADRDQPALEEIRAALHDQRPCQVLLRNYRKDGSVFWNELSIRPILNEEGQVVYFVGVQHDVTSNLENQARLEYLSSHDSLTGLFNRSYFHTSIDQMAAAGQLPIAIMVADMDGLKQINDSNGHASGDARLQRAAELFQRAFREQDVVARLGGDEFAVLMPSTNLYQGRRLLDSFRAYLELHSQENPEQAISFSCGLALLSEVDGIERVLHMADMAMYADKARRKMRA